MVHRSYDQYCPIAAALDVLGDRWTLLIMRELTMGERASRTSGRRCRASRPTCSPTACASCRPTSSSSSASSRRPRPAPCTRRRTPGARSCPSCAPLARFGADRLDPPGDDDEVLPHMAVYTMVSPYHVPEAAGERFHARLSSTGGRSTS